MGRPQAFWDPANLCLVPSALGSRPQVLGAGWGTGPLRGQGAGAGGEVDNRGEGLVAVSGWTMGYKLLTRALGVIPGFSPALASGRGSESRERRSPRPGGREGHVGVLVLPVPPPGVW